MSAKSGQFVSKNSEIVCQVTVVCLRSCRSNTLAGNGSGLGVVAAFSHYASIEAPKFKFSKNFHTKHFARHYAKPLLPAGVLSASLCNPLSVLSFLCHCRVGCVLRFLIFLRVGEFF